MKKVIYSAIFIFYALVVIALLNMEFVLYSDANRFGSVYVVGNLFKRCIKIDDKGSAAQSCYDRLDKDDIMFEYIRVFYDTEKFFPGTPNRVLMIGLGGGTLPSALNKKFPDAKLDVVEINPLMLKIAKEYFDFQPNENVNVYIEDGAEFVIKSDPALYDIVYIDAYDNDVIPAVFADEKFIEKLSKIIAQNGVVSMNVYKPELNKEIINKYKSHFKRSKEVTAGDNIVLFLWD